MELIKKRYVSQGEPFYLFDKKVEAPQGGVSIEEKQELLFVDGVLKLGPVNLKITPPEFGWNNYG
ncbi:hypothetical protein MUDAN_DOGOELCO_03389 [Lactiplantibacillus mudanjiangensis]|nr:hypothetical protein MUDAN_DOGOELCO_03389 [Lactiplantibacillus mudanjiangensis]